MTRNPGPRFPGVDEQGRPIVAELGRAETPEETAARKAAATANHRGANRSVLSLVFALVASLALVAFLVLVVVRPDAGPSRDPVDYRAAAEAAQSSVAETLVAPELPEGWYATRARLVTSAADGVVRWELGLVTAREEYLSIVQGLGANPTWVAGQVLQAAPGPVVPLGGLDWTSYDRRDVDDPGNLAAALVAEAGGSTVVVGGTADDEELAALAEAVAAELAP